MSDEGRGDPRYRRVEPPPLFPAAVTHVASTFDLRLGEGPAPAEIAWVEAMLGAAVPKRRAEVIAGRLCARAAILAAAPALGDPVIPASPDRAPSWPGDLVGSITHTAGYAAAAVARADAVRGLGLDTEVTMTAAAADEVRARLATMGEIAEAERALGVSREAALTLVFSAKESLYKCLYPRVRRYFDFLDAEAVAFTADDCVLCLRADLGEGLRAGAGFTARFVWDGRQVHTGILV